MLHRLLELLLSLLLLLLLSQGFFASCHIASSNFLETESVGSPSNRITKHVNVVPPVVLGCRINDGRRLDLRLVNASKRIGLYAFEDGCTVRTLLQIVIRGWTADLGLLESLIDKDLDAGFR